MKKYVGWIFALVTSLTMISAYADENEMEENDSEEQLAVIIDDDADEVEGND